MAIIPAWPWTRFVANGHDPVRGHIAWQISVWSKDRTHLPDVALTARESQPHEPVQYSCRCGFRWAWHFIPPLFTTTAGPGLSE